MRVLIACEFSGIVRDAFLARGHDAISCDLVPTERPGPHIIGDVRGVLDRGWDLMIAHPPCTYLAKSGVRWLYRPNGEKDAARWRKMEEGARFFRALFLAPIPRVAVENPVIHRYAREIIGCGHDQLIHPWQHGHGERKRTCLWLRGLPELEPTNIVPGREEKVQNMPDSKGRARLRSITYPGIAAAFAAQWG